MKILEFNRLNNADKRNYLKQNIITETKGVLANHLLEKLLNSINTNAYHDVKEVKWEDLPECMTLTRNFTYHENELVSHELELGTCIHGFYTFGEFVEVSGATVTIPPVIRQSNETIVIGAKVKEIMDMRQDPQIYKFTRSVFIYIPEAFKIKREESVQKRRAKLNE